ncbi:MAG: hypothetical protein HY824_15070 [Acidobacteria bacterium]|nr:hypothetical protein [Acidobacteriota bacterium]
MRLCLAALVLVVGATPATAQWLDRPWPGIPRTADGKPNLTAPAPRGPDGKPDLTGIWNGPSPYAGYDPSNEKPWATALVRRRQQEYFRERPSFLCRPSGPESDEYAGWRRVLQTPTAMAILFDDLTYRVIHMDGRALEANPAPSWMGYSVGRWDGDTLVVESNGYNDKTWLSPEGRPHTEALRAMERYRRTDFGHLQVDVTYTDPDAYLKPWGFTARLTLVPDTEMLETVCERSSDQWPSRASAASAGAVTVPLEVLARYVGVYEGHYGPTRPRTIEVSLEGGQLIAKVTGSADDDGGPIRPLVPRSQRVFEGLGLGYEFVVDDKGVGTELVEIHISGPYRYARKK